MDERASRLPVVQKPQLPATSEPMQALVTTAKRGAALVAAGAVARFVIARAARHLLNSAGTQVPAKARTQEVTVAKPSPQEPAAFIEEVFYYRRTVRRR